MSDSTLAAEFEHLIAAALYLNSTEDLSTLCRHILEAGCQVLGSEAASLMIRDPSSGQLHWMAALGVAGPLILDETLRCGEGIAGWVAEAGQSVVSNDPQNDPRFSQRIDALSGFVTRHLLCVPMVLHGRVYGVLEFLNRPADQPFDEVDVRKALAFASMAAVTLENGRLIRVAEEVGNVREISRFKTEMVSVVAHEMRNPLTSIRGFSEMLATEDGLPFDKAREFGERIYEEAGRMDRLITDFLNLSRLESGSLPLADEPFELAAVMRRSVDKLDGLYPQHPISLEVPPDATVHGDAARTEQIVDNLLSNAVKYSPDGGVVRLEVRPEGATWRVAVSDHGLGIAPEHTSRLFHHFYRVPEKSHRKVRGSGLGLTIVKTLVEKMGGRVGCDSQAGVGSTFWFTLPRAAS
jgi:signal transduction histidine kinase